MARESSTASTWRSLGRDDPYYAVWTDDAFRRGRMDAAAREAFFASGAAHVAAVMADVRRHVAGDFRPRRALDFGSGVGRLVIPLAREADEVLGVDVSPEMNAEAARNCAERGVANVRFALSDDELSQVDGTFDFVHSFIVFQHIPPPRGERLLARLLERLAPGGVGALHFTYARRAPAWRKAVNRLRRHLRVVNAVVNLAQGRAAREAVIPMYEYRLDRLLDVLRARGCGEVHATLTDHGGHHGALLLFRAPGSPAGAHPTPSPRT